MPPNMADWLPADHLVWFVLDVVAELDTTGFHSGRRRGGVGRAGYDPDMLLGLLIYSYAVGERSSRRIERLCIDHVAFRVACAGDGPDHTTIARFRAEHQDRFAGVFAQVLRLCASRGMVKVGSIAIDGTKIAADASRGANRTPASIREEAARIAAEVITQAAATDAAEDHLAAGKDRSDDDLPPGFDTRSGRAANIAAALAELDAQDADDAQADAADQRNVEDLYERARAGERFQGLYPAGVDPVLWCQARIEGLQTLLDGLDGVRGPRAASQRRDLKAGLARARHGLVKAEQAAAAGIVDRRGRAERARDKRHARARARGGTGPTVNVTDPDSRLMTAGSGGGSIQGYNAQLAVTDDHLILGIHVSQAANDTGCYQPTLTAATTHATALGLDIGLVLADAGYFTIPNLTAPGPDRLIAPGKNRDLNNLTIDPDTDPADLSPLSLMRHRLADPDNRDRYRRRSATVEPVIGHIKDQIGLTRFARRGLHAVTSELQLAATALNLTKLHRAARSTI